MSRVRKPGNEAALAAGNAVETVAQLPPIEGTTQPEASADEIAPLVDGAIQSQQEDARGEDSGVPGAIDEGQVAYPTGPIAADLTPGASPVSVAAKLVEGEPDPGLVEAVRRILAGEYAAPSVPFGSALPPERDAKTRLGHRALMDLDLDCKSYAPLETVFVTEAEFDRLKAGHVFAGWWDEGEERA